MNIYKSAKGKIRTKDGLSEEFNILKGILQGDSLSPKLFTIFIDDVVERLEKAGTTAVGINNVSLHLLLYADDIIVLSNNLVDLNNKIDCIREYFVENDLKVNLGKTKIVTFRTNKRKVLYPAAEWGGERIELVNEYRYLGVLFNNKLDYTKIFEDFKNKAQRCEYQLRGIIWKAKINSPNVIIKLYNTLCNSVLLYSSHIWGIYVLPELCKVQYSFMKRLCNLPSNTPSWFIPMEFGLVPITYVVLKSVLRYIIKICRKPDDCLERKLLVGLVKHKGIPKNIMKYNWVRDCEKVFHKLNCNDLFQEFVKDELSRQITGKDSEILYRIKEYFVTKYIQESKNSRSVSMYKEIKLFWGTEKFMLENKPWYLKSLGIQLRLNYPRIRIGQKYLLLNGLNKMYDNGKESKCLLCYMGTEDLQHVLFECPQYRDLRNITRSEFCNVGIEFNSNNYVNILRKIECAHLKILYKYFDNVIDIRISILDSILCL